MKYAPTMTSKEISDIAQLILDEGDTLHSINKSLVITHGYDPDDIDWTSVYYLLESWVVASR